MHGIFHVAVWVGMSVVVAELLGYLLHRLLHTGWIPWLSMSHMKHHMVLYGPLQKQRPREEYIDATTGRIALGNIGLEWIAPSAAILAILIVALRLCRVSVLDQALSMGTTLVWSFLMFSYLHDRMHMKNFWMERNAILKGWFRRSRRLHDIHHRVLNDRGLMDKNFGIGFFLFDRVFGTLSPEQSRFNHRGHAAARERFKYLDVPQAR
ncbi:MAG TPA: sterol desaturase family protein [Candidatus Sulfotelmatobacter sp.]|jgi:sterol desaturase/sphingolipid hydroxylase (fatty acid hydroxylase superfamily)|nr:sterol desaturase family protein [Candidatus Sulfotelmatobacter sp.]